MSAKHTPGPWVAETGAGRGAWIKGSDGEWSALSCGATDEVAEENARLIAAAPELLDALKWMVDNDETNEGDEPIPERNGETWDEINAYWLDGLNKARAAIAKAEGQA